jgi:hypothetical protein
MQGPIFSHVIFVDTNFSFWSFNLFVLSTPTNLRLILFIIDWLWSLSISIHSSILSNYQCYIFCPFSYNMSIFYPSTHFYSFCQSCPLCPFLSMFISIFIYFVIFMHSYSFCQFSPFYLNMWSITICLWSIIFVHPYSTNVCPWSIMPRSLFWG